MARFFAVEAMVWGYHKYKDIWEAEFGKQLPCQRETGNPHDLFAVVAYVYVRFVLMGVVSRINSDFKISWVNISWLGSPPRNFYPTKNTRYTVWWLSIVQLDPQFSMVPYQSRQEFHPYCRSVTVQCWFPLGWWALESEILQASLQDWQATFGQQMFWLAGWENGATWTFEVNHSML